MRSDPSDHTSASRSVANIESLSSEATPRRLTISISQRTLWVAAGVALVALVAILALTRALGALLLIFFAIILAEAVRPLVMRLERLRVPRPLGALLIYLVIAALLVVIGWLLFTPLAAVHSAGGGDQRVHRQCSSLCRAGAAVGEGCAGGVARK